MTVFRSGSVLGALVMLVIACSAQASTMHSSAYAFSSGVGPYVVSSVDGGQANAQGEGAYLESTQLVNEGFGIPSLSIGNIFASAYGSGGNAGAHIQEQGIGFAVGDDYKLLGDKIAADFSVDGGPTATFDSVSLVIGGQSFLLPDNPAPNTSLESLGIHVPGLQGIINEQGDGYVNALHFIFTDFDFGGQTQPLSGHVIFAHAGGGVVADVPAPSGFATLLLIGLGIGAIAVFRRRDHV